VLTKVKKSVKLYTDNVLEEFYKHLLRGSLENLHIPHSDVFYVREAVQNHYGRSFTLKHVEDAMRAEGWTEQSHSNPDYGK
tara:strand:- start:1043 stop:1285 length:243 start_codon:yes stop_codon:yes gene_type:complete